MIVRDCVYDDATLVTRASEAVAEFRRRSWLQTELYRSDVMLRWGEIVFVRLLKLGVPLKLGDSIVPVFEGEDGVSYIDVQVPALFGIDAETRDNIWGTTKTIEKLIEQLSEIVANNKESEIHARQEARRLKAARKQEEANARRLARQGK